MNIWATFTYKKFSTLLKKYGCEHLRTNGSHEVRHNPKDGTTFVVVHHKNEAMRIGTLKKVIEQSKIPEEYFLNSK